jgi:hypothetical protein
MIKRKNLQREQDLIFDFFLQKKIKNQKGLRKF